MNNGSTRRLAVGMIHGEIQDTAAVNGVLHFLHYFWPSRCEFTYSNKRFERSDVISLKRLGPVAMSVLSRSQASEDTVSN